MPPYFQNGSAATLNAVVQQYNDKQRLNLTALEMTDLAEYLKLLQAALQIRPMCPTDSECTGAVSESRARQISVTVFSHDTR